MWEEEEEEEGKHIRHHLTRAVEDPWGVDHNLGRVPTQLLENSERRGYEERVDVRSKRCLSPFPGRVSVSVRESVCDFRTLPVFVRRIPRLDYVWSYSHSCQGQYCYHHHPPGTRRPPRFHFLRVCMYISNALTPPTSQPASQSNDDELGDRCYVLRVRVTSCVCTCVRVESVDTVTSQTDRVDELGS